MAARTDDRRAAPYPRSAIFILGCQREAPIPEALITGPLCEQMPPLSLTQMGGY